MWKLCKYLIFEFYYVLFSFVSYYLLIFLIKNMKIMNFMIEYDIKNEFYKYCKFCILVVK